MLYYNILNTIHKVDFLDFYKHVLPISKQQKLNM